MKECRKWRNICFPIQGAIVIAQIAGKGGQIPDAKGLVVGRIGGNGSTNGTGLFSVRESVACAQLCTILYRYLDIAMSDLTMTDFLDMDAVPEWAAPLCTILRIVVYCLWCMTYWSPMALHPARIVSLIAPLLEQT